MVKQEEVDNLQNVKVWNTSLMNQRTVENQARVNAGQKPELTLELDSNLNPELLLRIIIGKLRHRITLRMNRKTWSDIIHAKIVKRRNKLNKPQVLEK